MRCLLFLSEFETFTVQTHRSLLKQCTIMLELVVNSGMLEFTRALGPSIFSRPLHLESDLVVRNSVHATVKPTTGLMQYMHIHFYTKIVDNWMIPQMHTAVYCSSLFLLCYGVPYTMVIINPRASSRTPDESREAKGNLSNNQHHRYFMVLKSSLVSFAGI